MKLNVLEIIKIDENEEDKGFKLNFIEKTKSEIETDKLETVMRVQMAKDMSFLADDNYTMFRKISKINELPSIHYIRKERERINGLLPSIKSNKFGLYCPVEEKIILLIIN